jgi:probable rRNA maturation factor
MIDVINLQRKVSLNTKFFKDFVKSLSSLDIAADKVFSVAFISDDRMRQLNQTFRGKDSTTDVLSFPNHPDEFDADQNNLGDIVISAEQAQKQADENGLDLETEMQQLILHGVLHLCGHDHESDDGEMNALELELRDKLGINE